MVFKKSNICLLHFVSRGSSSLGSAFGWIILGSIYFLEGGGGVSRRNPYEHECKISPAHPLYFC